MLNDAERTVTSLHLPESGRTIARADEEGKSKGRRWKET
jgi:hypothetical protein